MHSTASQIGCSLELFFLFMLKLVLEKREMVTSGCGEFKLLTLACFKVEGELAFCLKKE